MMHVQACLGAMKDGKGVFTTLELLWSSCRAVFGPGKIEKGIFTTVEVL